MAAEVLEREQAANPAGDPEAEMQELYALSSESYELASLTCAGWTMCTVHLACCE